MKMGIPVIGLVPNITPEWMNEENGIWINNQNMIVDVIADFIQNWLEDNIKPELYDNMKKTVENYTNKQGTKKTKYSYRNQCRTSTGNYATSR